MRLGVELANQSGHFAAVISVLEMVDSLFPTFTDLDPNAPDKIKTFFQKLEITKLSEFDHWKNLVEKAREGLLKPWEYFDAIPNISYPSIEKLPTLAETKFLPYAKSLHNRKFNSARTTYIHRPAHEFDIADKNSTNMIMWRFLRFIHTLLIISWHLFLKNQVKPLYNNTPQTDGNTGDTALIELESLLTQLKQLEKNKSLDSAPQDAKPKRATKILNDYLEHANDRKATVEGLCSLIDFLDKSIKYIKGDFSKAEAVTRTPATTTQRSTRDKYYERLFRAPGWFPATNYPCKPPICSTSLK